MRVTATATGYFGKIRQPGETFDMPQGSKGSWFVPAKDDKPVRKPPAGGQGNAQGQGNGDNSNDLV